MRTKYLLIFSAATALAAGCTKEIEKTPQDNVGYAAKTFVAGIGEETKTSVDAAGKVSWKAGDVVRYYSKDGVTPGTCSVAEDGSSATLSMDVAEDASYLVAIYGGREISGNTASGVKITGAVPSVQTGAFGNSHIAAVKITDLNTNKLNFHNITSYIRFTIRRDDIKKVVFTSIDGTALTGYSEVNLNFSSEGINADLGSNTGPSIIVNNGGPGTFYIATLPCTMSKGFKADCYDADSKLLGTAWSEKSVTISSGTILNIGTLEPHFGDESYKNLSTTRTANCYIVSKSGNYKFKTVKGNSEESVGAVSSAEVLWETFGTATAPSDGDLVSDVAYSDGYISFITSGKKGNAVIAAKDASGTILWSWHIWMTDLPVNQKYNNNAGNMMDRNLGATSATPGDPGALGLMYQWGRKDPFLGSSSISSDVLAASTITWPSAVASSSSNGTIAYAVANPTTFINYNSGNKDWYYTGTSSTENTRWLTSDKSKSVYDPCPAGYRVPDGGNAGVWSKAFNISEEWTTTNNWNSTNKGMDFGATNRTLGLGTIWYPAGGYRDGQNGSLLLTGNNGYSWSCSPSGSNAYYLMFSSDDIISPTRNKPSRADGLTVRCITDTTTGTPGLTYDDDPFKF